MTERGLVPGKLGRRWARHSARIRRSRYSQPLVPKLPWHGGGPTAGRSPGGSDRSPNPPMCPFQEGQRDRARGLQSLYCGRRRTEARLGLSGQPRPGLLRRGVLTDPEGPVVPAWAGVTALELRWQPQIKWRRGPKSPPQEANLKGTAPPPKRGCSAVRFRAAARAAWTLLWNRAQARVIRCTLSTLAEASTPPVRAVSKRKGATDKGDTNSVPRGTRPLHRRRTRSINLPEGNDLLVGRVNPPAGAGARRNGPLRRSRVMSATEQVRSGPPR